MQEVALTRDELIEIVNVTAKYICRIKPSTKIPDNDRFYVDSFEFGEIYEMIAFLQKYGHDIPVSRLQLLLDFTHQRLRLCFEDPCTTQQ